MLNLHHIYPYLFYIYYIDTRSFYDLQVLIGHYENLVGHLRYKSGGELSKEVIIGIAVGCSLLLLILSLVLVACCVYRRKHQSQGQNQNTTPMTERQSDLVYMPPL